MRLRAARAPASGDRSVSRSAFLATLGSFFSVLAGFANQMVIAWLFGAGLDMDAYLTASVVPTYVQAVLLAGLPFVLIPAFVRVETEGREEEAWALGGTFMWLTVGALVAAAVVCSLFASHIIALTAPGLEDAKAELASTMLAIVMWSVPLTGLTLLSTGIQNARGHFFWPTAAGALGSIASLLTTLLLYRKLGPLSLAWGYLAFEASRVCVTSVPVVRRAWNKVLPLGDSNVRETLRLMIPFVVFGFVTRSSPVFERYFASGLPDGDLSYLGYGAKVANISMVLLGAGIVTASFPAMARAYSTEGQAALARQLEYGLRLALAVALPALAIMSGVAVPLVAVLFERGAFDHTATLNVSRILSIVLLGRIVFPTVANLQTRTFYVLKDTRTVPILGFVTSILYIVAAKLLTDAWGYVGLALAVSVEFCVSVSVLFVLLKRKLRPLHMRAVAKSTLMYAGASLVAFLSAWGVVSALADLPSLIQLLGASVLAGSAYLGLLFWIDRDIAQSTLEVIGVQRAIVAVRAGLRRAGAVTHAD